MTNRKGKDAIHGSSQLRLPLLQQALQQVEESNLKIRALEEEIAKLKQQFAEPTSAVSEFAPEYDTHNTGSATPVSHMGNENPDRLLTRPGVKAATIEASDPFVNPATQESRNPNILTPEKKIALFRDLFIGRQDVYALRWQSASTGKSGYQPARRHDFNNHIYDPKKKKKICTMNCPDLPLTDEVLKHHLQGKHTIGTYPLLLDDTCPFLAIDLDKADWQEDARSLLASARALNIPAYLERSRSGNGGHVWIFFERPVLAATARRLGEVLITRSNQGNHPLSLQSYDRMFPNQDMLPKLGYGNLIALPLQKDPLARGNSAFLDEHMTPHAHQWGFLQSIQKLQVSDLDQIVRDATRNNKLIPVARPNDDDGTTGKADPWTSPPSGQNTKDAFLQLPFPATIKITLGNFIYIDKAGLTKSHINRLTRIAAFQNPEFYQNQALRLSTFKIPRIICCAEDYPEHLCLPRGCLDELKTLLKASGASCSIEDKRFVGKKIKAKFTGKLHADQTGAAKELLKFDTGVLCAATAFGKTVLAAYCISKRKVNTLVLVHRQQLMEQWQQRLAEFLELPPHSIGQIGAGRNKPTGRIDIATIQSLQTKGEIKDLVANYGQVIVDECHHIGAVSFESVLKQVKAKFVLGLTATPVRKDGHHPIVVMQCGPIRYRVRHKDHASAIKEHVVLPRVTKAKVTGLAEKFDTQELLSLLVFDQMRNQMIIEDVLKAIAEKRTPLVLTERVQHLQLIAEALEGKVKNIIVYKGGLGKKQKSAIKQKLDSVPHDEECVVLATGRYIGEGFDYSRLDTLFLALPISWRGTLEQYAGRLHRDHEGKSMVQIYDYIDLEIDKLYRMFKKRQSGYKLIGYKIANESEPAHIESCRSQLFLTAKR